MSCDMFRCHVTEASMVGTDMSEVWICGQVAKALGQVAKTHRWAGQVSGWPDACVLGRCEAAVWEAGVGGMGQCGNRQACEGGHWVCVEMGRVCLQVAGHVANRLVSEQTGGSTMDR